MVGQWCGLLSVLSRRSVRFCGPDEGRREQDEAVVVPLTSTDAEQLILQHSRS